MTLETGPADPSTVAARLKITGDTPPADLTAAVAAVNVIVRGLPKAQVPVDLGLDAWPADIVEGATMLATRIYRRRNSPAGVEAFGDLGPVYVQRNDPDIALLLGIGAYTKPQVG